MNTLYVVFMGWTHHGFYLSEAGAREYVRKYVEEYHSGDWKEVSKNRWEWKDFSITIEEKELYE